MAEIMRLDQARRALAECGCYGFEERRDDTVPERTLFLSFKDSGDVRRGLIIWNHGNGDFVLADDVRKVCQVIA